MQEKWWQVLEKMGWNKMSIGGGHLRQDRAEEWRWRGGNPSTTVFSDFLVSAILPRGFLPEVSHLNLRLPQNSRERTTFPLHSYGAV